MHIYYLYIVCKYTHMYIYIFIYIKKNNNIIITKKHINEFICNI